MFKQLASVVLAASAAFAPQAAMADEIQTLKGGYRYLDPEHKVLVDAIVNTGVSVQVNVGDNCDSGNDGVYKPQEAILAICQDKAPRPHWSEVRWTPNDLDTLRHEAVHLLQDCNAGDGVGGYSRHWFGTDEKRVEFVKSALSERKIKWIFEAYGDLSDWMIEAELEAFAVAEVIEPDLIAKAIRDTCPAY